ncbi:MAG: M56 family metallopeptidase [Bacillota bacterium]
MALPVSELHTFLIYAVFGYALVYPLALLCLKLFSIDHPGQRRHLYLLALLAPAAGFLLYHTVLTKRCQAELIHPETGGGLLQLICLVSDRALQYAAPILAFVFGLGLLKAGAAVLLVRRLRMKAVQPSAGLAWRVETILKRRCHTAAAITAPEVIYSSRTGFAAFTAGLIKPVLVLNYALAAELTEQELDAVLAHELVHISRKDTVKNWLLSLLRDLTFFNPISTILMRRIMLENERICDREAVVLTGHNNATYAAVLLRVWRLILEQRPFQSGPVSAFTGGGNELEDRLTALLRSRNGEKPLPSWIFRPLTAVFIAVTILFLGLIC